MITKQQAAEFGLHLAEDAIKAGAGGALLAITGATANLFTWDWLTIGGAAGAGAFISVLFSLGAQRVGDPATTSVLGDGAGKHVSG